MAVPLPAKNRRKNIYRWNIQCQTHVKSFLPNKGKKNEAR